MTTHRLFALMLLSVSILGAGCAMDQSTSITVVEKPPTDKTNAFYTGNKPPLAPAAFVKLPIGSIEPRGWLRTQLELERDGMTGHLQEISKWCKFENNAWVTPGAQG